MPKGIYNHKKGYKRPLFSDEWKKNLSESNKGRKLSEEHKKNIGLSGIGRKHTKETKNKISVSNKGKTRSIEAKKRISESLKGRKCPPRSQEYIDKIKRRMRGNKYCLGIKREMSEEWKRNIGLSHKGKKYPNRKSPPPFSIETRNKISKIHKGEKCHFWKGGITKENDKIRTSLEMKLWKKSCMERDNFTCQKTGEYGGELVVHHINNFADFPELRTSLENGITLSKKAHVEFHKIYGKRNNTREQLEKFLKQ